MTNVLCMCVHGIKKDSSPNYTEILLRWVGVFSLLLVNVSDDFEPLICSSEKRKGTIFRNLPTYQGFSWGRLMVGKNSKNTKEEVKHFIKMYNVTNWLKRVVPKVIVF